MTHAVPSGSSQGECQCSDCFMLNSNGTCEASLCPDYLYNNNSNVCGADSRPSQLTAFLLTLFVASTGAGNFYIGQDALGDSFIHVTHHCTHLGTHKCIHKVLESSLHAT